MEQSRATKMPLSEVTQLYGAEGLEECFRDEVKALLLSPEDQLYVDSALSLALFAHEPQTRGENPYSTHFLRVATRIIRNFEVTNPSIIIAALLHDTVEDQPGRIVYGDVGPKIAEDVTQRPAALACIRYAYGEEVAELVSDMTIPPPSPLRNKAEQYQKSVIMPMGANPKVRIIRLSDLIDNCTGIIYNESPQLAYKLAGKYRPLIPAMVSFTLMPDTPLEQNARDYILERLHRGDERCQTVLRAA